MTDGDELGRNFTRLLIEDVIAARTRLDEYDTPLHRREVVRATFAAIEGMTWILRVEVRNAARQLRVLTPGADLALRERTISITERGEVVEQVRFLTLPTVIRMTARQARLVAPDLSLDFAGRGWSDLKAAIDTRNRVTHPKSAADLDISSADLATTETGLSWLLSSIETALFTINAALAVYRSQVDDVVQGLVEGDAQTHADYRAAQMLDDDEDM